MDDRLRTDGLTTQQAALLTLVAALGAPSLKQAAAGLGTTHQNVAQLVRALQRKGMLAIHDDPADGRRKLLSVTDASHAYWRADARCVPRRPLNLDRSLSVSPYPAPEGVVRL